MIRDASNLPVRLQDTGECERHVRRALSVDPHNPEALMLSARLHLVRGDRGAMHEAMESAVHADPIGYGTRWYYIVMLYLPGAFDRSVAEADRLLAEAPGLRTHDGGEVGRAACLAMSRADSTTCSAPRKVRPRIRGYSAS